MMMKSEDKHEINYEDLDGLGEADRVREPSVEWGKDKTGRKDSMKEQMLLGYEDVLAGRCELASTFFERFKREIRC
jgi:hypothetical protein